MASERVQHWLDATPPAVVEAIRADFHGKATREQRRIVADWVTETVTGAPVRRDTALRPMKVVRPPLPYLSDRQVDILSFAADGCGVDEVAALMHVAKSTVNRNRIKVCEALGARNITHAVAIWIRGQT